MHDITRKAQLYAVLYLVVFFSYLFSLSILSNHRECVQSCICVRCVYMYHHVCVYTENST